MGGKNGQEYMAHEKSPTGLVLEGVSQNAL